MGNWIVHSLIGILLGIACIIINLGSEYTFLIGAVLAAVIGSLLPDIDHKKSKVRGIFRWLTIVSILLIIYFTFSSLWDILPDLSFIISGNLSMVFIVFALSLFIAYLITSFIESLIPRHRGPLHRVFASIMYSFLVFVAATVLGLSHSFLIAVWGFIGYLSHVIVDILI